MDECANKEAARKPETRLFRPGRPTRGPDETAPVKRNFRCVPAISDHPTTRVIGEFAIGKTDVANRVGSSFYIDARARSALKFRPAGVQKAAVFKNVIASTRQAAALTTIILTPNVLKDCRSEPAGRRIELQPVECVVMRIDAGKLLAPKIVAQ